MTAWSSEFRFLGCSARLPSRWGKRPGEGKKVGVEVDWGQRGQLWSISMHTNNQAVSIVHTEKHISETFRQWGDYNLPILCSTELFCCLTCRDPGVSPAALIPCSRGLWSQMVPYLFQQAQVLEECRSWYCIRGLGNFWGIKTKHPLTIGEKSVFK